MKDQEALDRVTADHGCPNNCGTTTYGPEYTMSLLAEVWEQLDVSVTYLKENPNGVEAEWHKAYAQGLAFVLAKFMTPHFRTPKEVSAEALKRYNEREAGRYYDTPGIASKRYVLPDYGDVYKGPAQRTLAEGADSVRSASSGGIAARAATGKKLNDTERAGIINGKGFFPASELARMYGVPEAQIESVWSEVQ
jgi:hypothetical protein